MTKPALPAPAASEAPAAPFPADRLAFTPVPRQRMRRGGWSAARQRQFIELLAETGSVRAACRRLGVGEYGVYALRRHPGAESFRQAWEAALDMGIQRIEDVAMDRALNGVEAPVFFRGEQVGTRQVHNDRLLMFLLSNRSPSRFAQGNARSRGSVSPSELARLKQEWRKEWEAEQAASNVSPAEVRASIDRKVEEVRLRLSYERERHWVSLSDETRAAWAHFVSLRDRDLTAIGADAATRRVMATGWQAGADALEKGEGVRRLERPRPQADEGFEA